MDRKIIKKYAVITIIIVISLQLVMMLLRCSVDKMNVDNSDSEKVVESVETINEVETQVKKNKVDREFDLKNLDDSVGALLKNDNLWQDLALTEHFLNKYKSRFDIIPELKYPTRVGSLWFDFDKTYYDKENANNIITMAFQGYDDVFIENIDFDEPVGAIRYEIKLYLTENKELNDIEILSKRPFTTEEYVWEPLYPPEINNVLDLICACGGKIDSQEYFQEDFLTSNSEVIYNSFTTINLILLDAIEISNQEYTQWIKWYDENKKNGECKLFAEYRDGSILYYKVVFELDDDRKIKYLEYIPIEAP